MCGIAGFIGRAEIEPEKIERTLRLMKNRGPDFQNHAHIRVGETQIYLLHSRLGIIDLDPRSNQPFTFQDCTIIFNGEIYNYLELRRELEKQGENFQTESDTEVLLRYYLKYGENCVKFFEGMWSFALFDRRKGRLFLSRDRFGEKPLYLLEEKEGLYFGSEIKFIAGLCKNRLEINFNHLYRYLINGYKSLYKAKETFYQKIQELSSGHLLTVKMDGTKETTRYWQFPSYAPVERSYEEVTQLIREALIDSVKIRLRADVPVAFCMSGGIDSNALISIAKRKLGYDVHGFTIANVDSRYEETDMIEHSVKELGIRHTTIPLSTDNFLDHLKTLIHYHDGPVYTITYYTQWCLMKSIAEQGYRISVSGTAADELFSGYYDHHLYYLSSIQQNASLFQKSKTNWEIYVQPFVRNPFLKKHDLFICEPSMRDYIYLNSNEFSKLLNNPWKEDFYEYAYSEDVLRNRMLNELFHESVPPILHEDDLNAMYYSVENRSPFLDRRLFELTMQIPTSLLIQRGYSKAILRDSMRGIVPEKILMNHRKVGFNAPIHSLLNTKDPNVLEVLLGDSVVYDYLQKKKIEELIMKETLFNSESKFLFYFLNFKLFLEETALCTTASDA